VPFVKTGDRAVPSLGVTAALRAAGIQPGDVRAEADRLVIGTATMPLEWRRISTSDGPVSYQWSLINFRGPGQLAGVRRHVYPTYSFYDLEQSEEQILQKEKPAIDPALFRDKVVFVGTTASGLFDVWETPFARGRMPGIQVHAAVTDDILSNRFIWPPSSRARVASVVAAGILVAAIATLLPAWWAAAITIGLTGLAGWLATVQLARGRWINLSQPVLAASLSLFGGVSYQYFVEGREKRKMKKLFGQYVSKDVYLRLVANPELARLGGQRRDMTVLFSDIRGFTTVTEQRPADEIVEMLNEYFTRMVDIVFRHGGTIDKFVGDMVMALFSAPLDDAEHADHAVEAALEMIDGLHELNARWKEQGRFAALDIGIGINTGPMIAGNIGSDAIMSYTVIGDAVNLGARLESLNKQYGTRIIISEATRQELKQAYDLRPLGEVVVKGKTQPVAIFEVVGRAARSAGGVSAAKSRGRL
jgi:adenylate cyclase